jgi:hypothetical protein
MKNIESGYLRKDGSHDLLLGYIGIQRSLLEFMSILPRIACTNKGKLRSSRTEMLRGMLRQ